MRYHLFKTLCLVFLVSTGLAQGELIVFLSGNGSEVDKAFQSNTLPKLKKFAEENEIAIKLKEGSKAAPEGITTLPAIIYQNHLGRSVYIGRFNQLDKMVNFIRTAKRIPQTKDAIKKEIVKKGYVFQDGRCTVELKTKITDLSGTKPKKYNKEEFLAATEKDVVDAMKKFDQKANYEVFPTDREFYANFYPYRAEDGQFYVTTELYSQFHCHEPIYTTLGNPFQGKWKDKDEVIAQAARDIEAKITFHSKNPENGDGFDPISLKVPVKSWQALSCTLPAPPAGQENIDVSIELPTEWQVKGPVSSLDPMVAFTFPPPVDNYSGEVKKLKGSLSINKELKLSSAKGDFQVDLNSLTMGDPDLDESVKSEDMLDVSNFPTATFTFNAMSPNEDTSLEFGKMQMAQAMGKFTFKGKTIDRTVNAQITPLVDEEGEPILQVSVSFSININPFEIEGPDGPKPQSNTINYMLNFNMTGK